MHKVTKRRNGKNMLTYKLLVHVDDELVQKIMEQTGWNRTKAERRVGELLELETDQRFAYRVFMARENELTTEHSDHVQESDDWRNLGGLYDD